MIQLRILAAVAGVALLVGACAQPAPTTAPATEPTVEVATLAPPTEALPTDEPTVSAEMVEPMPDDGAADPGPAPEGGAEPAVQLVPSTDLDMLEVGREAKLAVLTSDSDGIDRVELQIDGQVVSTVSADQATEFQGLLTWTPEKEGEHNAVVIAYDALGLPGQAEQRTLMVQPAAPTVVPAPGPTQPPTAVPPTPVPTDTTPPAVSITPLTPRVEPGEDIQIATNAVDESGVVKLELYMSNRLVDVWRHDPSAGAPARSVFQTLHFRRAREGQYDAWVRAYDAAGNVGESVRERVRVRPAQP